MRIPGAGLLRSAGLAAWMGRRLLRSGGGRSSLLVVAVVSFVSGLILLGVMGFGGVVTAQRAASAAQVPSSSDRATGLAAALSSLDWRDDFRVLIVQVGLDDHASADDPALAFPGAPRLPRAGEVLLSPALVGAMADDPVLATAFPQRRVGVLDAARLVSSQQMIAVVGVPLQDLTAQNFAPVTVFGSDESAYQLGQNAGTVLGLATVVGLVLLPLWRVLASAAAQLAAQRMRRVRLLTALGTSPARSRWLVTADSALAAVAGAGVACVLFPLLTRMVTHLPPFPVSWAPGQPQLTAMGMATALLLPLLTLAIVDVAVARRARNSTKGSQRFGGRWLGVTGGLLFSAGCVGVLLTYDRRAFASTRDALLISGTLACLVIGTPPIAQLIQQTLARWGLGKPRPAWLLLAAARVARGQGNSSRALTGVIAAFLFAIAVSPLITATAPYDDVTLRVNADTGRVIVFVEPAPPEPVAKRIATSRLVSGIAVPSGPADGGYRLDCATAQRLLVRPDCRPGSATTITDLPRDQGASWPSTGDWTFHEMPSAQVLADTAAQPADGRPLIVLTPDESTYWPLVAELTATYPTGAAYGNVGGLIGGPDQLARRVQQWLLAGLLLLLALTGAQLAIGVVTDTLERRRTERGLRALGAPERVLRTAILAEHGLLLAVAAFTAGTVGAVMIWAAPRWLNKTPIPSGWVATTYLTLFGVLVFAAAAALATVLPRDHEHRADDASMLME